MMCRWIYVPLVSFTFYLPNWWHTVVFVVQKAVKSVISGFHYTFLEANIALDGLLPFSDYLLETMSFSTWYECYLNVIKNATEIPSNLIMITHWIILGLQFGPFSDYQVGLQGSILWVFETYLDFFKWKFPLISVCIFMGCLVTDGLQKVHFYL